jgi:hypothetical protein
VPIGLLTLPKTETYSGAPPCAQLTRRQFVSENLKMISRRSLTWFILALCLAALAKFTIRGPVLAWQLSQDFKTFYVASRAWSSGINPYDHGALDSILDQVGAAGGVTLGKKSHRFVRRQHMQF